MRWQAPIFLRKHYVYCYKYCYIYGDDVLDDVLDAKQFWYKVYTLSVGDFNMLIRLVIQIIYVSWNRNMKRKIIVFNYTKLWFYVQIKHLIKDHCSDQAQKAETVLSAISLFIIVSLSYNLLISSNSAGLHMQPNPTCINICISPVEMFLSGRQAGDST